MQTTLNKIRACSPCASGWSKLLTNLGKTKADDAPLAITTILDSNGLDDALWCLRAVDGHQREMRLFAVDCARIVQHSTNDARSIAVIDVAEKHANGLATDAELDAARSAACSAARDAARSAACSAARDAAWSAARSAARSAAGSAAWPAAWDAARDAAWSAACSAARDAAWSAARSAARDAALSAAWYAAWDAAWAAAWAAVVEVQSDLLRIVCAEIEQV